MSYIVGIKADLVSDSVEFELGSIGQTSDGKVYKWVQYDTGSGSVAAASGNVAYYYTLDGYKNNQVSSDLSDSVEIGAGVLQSAPTDGQYCWIQIKGAATLTTALTAGADGDPLTPTGSSDGTLDVSAAVTDHVCAYAGDISDKEVICDFPF
tara:strand:- start:1409 stop:1864 length:456 start_codon:yes stop_codon:yes gene_type:complete